MPAIPDHPFNQRRTAIELGDMHWVPSFLRDGLRAFLNATHRTMKYYKPWAGVLADVLERTGQRQVVVLGAGGGQLSLLLQKELKEHHHLEVKFVLTDLNPVAGAAEAMKEHADVEYVTTPVNMTEVPEQYKGVRVVMNAFHHLKPGQAQAVLRNAYQARKPICIFEYTMNSLVGVSSSVLYPLFNMLIAPVVRPFKLSHLALTYLLPVYPLMIAFDGLMSNLRTYNRRELLGMVEGLRADFSWAVGYRAAAAHPTLLTHFVGIPAASDAGRHASDGPEPAGDATAPLAPKGFLRDLASHGLSPSAGQAG